MTPPTASRQPRETRWRRSTVDSSRAVPLSSRFSEAMSRRSRSASTTAIATPIAAGRRSQPARVAGADHRGEERSEQRRGEVELQQRVGRVPGRPRRHAVDVGAGRHAGDAEEHRERAEQHAARQPEPQGAGIHGRRRSRRRRTSAPRGSATSASTCGWRDRREWAARGASSRPRAPGRRRAATRWPRCRGARRRRAAAAARSSRRRRPRAASAPS